MQKNLLIGSGGFCLFARCWKICHHGINWSWRPITLIKSWRIWS